MKDINLWFSFLVIAVVLALRRVGYRDGRGAGREIPLKIACQFRV